MENNYKLTNLEAITLIIVIMINKLILNIPYYIVNLVGNGAIVNIFYIGIIDFIALLIIIKLFDKFQGKDILDISEFLVGSKFKFLVGIISIALLLLVAFITLLDFSNVLHTIYFSNFPMIFILALFITGIFFANIIGFKSLAHTIQFIVPISLASIFITFIASFKNFSIVNLTPVLGNNLYTTFGLGLANTFAMYIIVYIYFLKPLLQNENSFKKISIISYIISFILLLITVIPLLTLFNANFGNEPINSLFLLSRQVEFGTFIQRVDAIFIFLWILSIFSYLSFIIFLINRILKKMFNIFNEKMLTYSSCSILLGLTLIPLNIANIHFIEDTIYRYVVLSFIFGLGIIILILANFKNRKKGLKT